MGTLLRRITSSIRRDGVRLFVLVVAASTLFAGAEAPRSRAAVDAAWWWGAPGHHRHHSGRVHRAGATGTHRDHRGGFHPAKGHPAKGGPGPPNPAWRHPGAPSPTWSRYMDTVDPGRLSALGCALGRRVAAGDESADTVVVLDFGMPLHHKGRFGASLFGGPFANTVKIGWGLQAYARGYVRCSPKSGAHLELAGGTSNYGPDVTYKHGRMWGNMVN